MAVLAAERASDGTMVVTVLPVTHSAPVDPVSAIEIPSPIKRHLGLDHERSWIVVSEGNEFDWPGYDLRKIPGGDSYDYGFLPPGFFARVLAAFVSWHRANKSRLTSRE